MSITPQIKKKKRYQANDSLVDYTSGQRVFWGPPLSFFFWAITDWPPSCDLLADLISHKTGPACRWAAAKPLKDNGFCPSIYKTSNQSISWCAVWESQRLPREQLISGNPPRSTLTLAPSHMGSIHCALASGCSWCLRVYWRRWRLSSQTCWCSDRGKEMNNEDYPSIWHSSVEWGQGAAEILIHAYIAWLSISFSPQLCLTLCDPMDDSPPGSSKQEYGSGLPFPSLGIFPTQGLNQSLLHCRQILYHLIHHKYQIHKIYSRGTSLVVQGLRPQAFNVGGPGSRSAN